MRPNRKPYVQFHRYIKEHPLRIIQHRLLQIQVSTNTFKSQADPADITWQGRLSLLATFCVLYYHLEATNALPRPVPVLAPFPSQDLNVQRLVRTNAMIRYILDQLGNFRPRQHFLCHRGRSSCRWSRDQNIALRFQKSWAKIMFLEKGFALSMKSGAIS